MNQNERRWSRLFASTAVLCIPLALQCASAAPSAVPEAMWLILALSVWASLTAAAMAALVLGALLLRGWRQAWRVCARREERARRAIPRGGSRHGAHALSAAAWCCR